MIKQDIYIKPNPKVRFIFYKPLRQEPFESVLFIVADCRCHRYRNLHGCSAFPLPLANRWCSPSLHHLWQVLRHSLCHPHTHLWSYSSSTSLKYILSGAFIPNSSPPFIRRLWHDCPHLSLRSSLHLPTSLPSHYPAVRHNPSRYAPFSSIFSYASERDAP